MGLTINNNVDLEHVNCNLCGSNDYVIFLEQEDNRYPETPRYRFRLVKCKKCKLIYLNPRPSLRLIGRYYTDNYSVYKRINDSSKDVVRYINYLDLSYWRRKMLQREKLSIVRRFCHNQEVRLLEIGPGGGSFLKSIKGIGWEATGVEISSDMCNHIKNTYNIECLNKDINSLNDYEIKQFANDKFDIVVFWSSFEHLYDPKGALVLCRNFVKDNGKLVIFVPNADNLEERFLKKIDKNPVDVPRHLYHFNKSTINKLFDITGFKPVKMFNFTLIEHSRFKVNMNRLISDAFKSKSNVSKIIRFILYNLSTLIGDALSLILSVFKRSHSIIIVGEKKKVIF